MTAVVYAGQKDMNGFTERMRGLGIESLLWVTPDASPAFADGVEAAVNDSDCLIVKNADGTPLYMRLLDAALTRRVPVLREECVELVKSITPLHGQRQGDFSAGPNEIMIVNYY